MYLSNWKRTAIFELIPILKNNQTVYSKQNISNPDILDCWNFFIRFKKVRQLTHMLKENKNTNFISIDGKNALEIALELQYLPLLKTVLDKNNISLLLGSDSNGKPILDNIWSVKFNLYKNILVFIKTQCLENYFTDEQMYLLINSEVEKMVYFEKVFPGLFLKIFPEKIDNLHPKFQYVLLQHDILKNKLSRKFKPKQDKKIIFKI